MVIQKYMRNILLLILLITVSGIFSTSKFLKNGVLYAGINEWTTIGPEGGKVQALVIDPQNPDILYAGTNGAGIFKSTDGGQTWASINNGLSEYFIKALAIDPQIPSIVYAGSNLLSVGYLSGGIFKSTDGGQTWKGPREGVIGGVESILIDPLTPSNVYVSTALTSVFKSSDKGEHWLPIDNGPEITFPLKMGIHPDNPAILYLGTLIGVYKSIDGGQIWLPVNNGLEIPNTELFMHVIDLVIDSTTKPETVYIGTKYYGVFKSTDGGTSWQSKNNGLAADTSVHCLALDGTTLYASTSDGLYKSIDRGESWFFSGNGLNDITIETLAVSPGQANTLYAGTSSLLKESGVYKSIDGGANWTAVNKGLTGIVVENLVIDPSSPDILYASTVNSGIFKSTNEGRNWNFINSGLLIQDFLGINSVFRTSSISSLVIHPTTPTTLYAGTLGSGVFRSFDGGNNWTAINNGIMGSSFFNTIFVNSLVIDRNNPLTIYAGLDFYTMPPEPQCSFAPADLWCYSVGYLFIEEPGTIGVIKSTDGGENWSAVNNGLIDLSIQSLTGDPQNSQTLYGGTYSQGIFKTTNGGESWSAINNGLTPGFAKVVMVDPQLPTTVYASLFENGIFKSTNSGENWTAINNGLVANYVTALAINPTVPSNIFAGTFQNGVFMSTNSGASWTSLNSGLQSKNISALAIKPDGSIPYAGILGQSIGTYEFAAVEQGSITKGKIFDKNKSHKDKFIISLERCNGLAEAIKELEKSAVHITVGTFDETIEGSDFEEKKNRLKFKKSNSQGKLKYILFPGKEKIKLVGKKIELDGEIEQPILVRIRIEKWICESVDTWNVRDLDKGKRYKH
jgi:photosystem II stability/assembly factor-like uncharacterized protein